MKRLLSLLLSVLFAGGATAAAAAAKRPNVLWFVVDDISPSLSCYGEAQIDTPNIDRLAREGTLFKHAYTTAPVCSPCRSAFITGMYQTTIGAHHHRSGRGVEKIHLPEGVVPIPVLFQQAGYYTCIGHGVPATGRKAKKIAKRKAEAAPDGGRQALGKTDYNFEWDPKMYDSNDWAGRKPGQPFFMQVQMGGGKLRGGTDESAQALAERARTELGRATDPAKVILPPYYPRDPVLLRDWAAYLDAVRFTDQQVGAVLARLEQEGILADTLVIFTSDHGISHARGKQFLYDEGTHIPFIVRGPGVPKGDVREDLIQQIDLAPLSLAAAGIPIPPVMQAKNVLASNYQRRDFVIGARDRCDETVDRIRSIRTDRFLYIRNFHPQRPLLQPNAYKDGKSIVQTLRALHETGKLDPVPEALLFRPTRPKEELYEWTMDRWQVTNLAADSGYQKTLESLREKLDRWMTQTKDRGPESEKMYDSDMEVYLGGRAIKGKGETATGKNILLMKEWTKQGI